MVNVPVCLPAPQDFFTGNLREGDILRLYNIYRRYSCGHGLLGAGKNGRNAPTEEVDINFAAGTICNFHEISYQILHIINLHN